MSRARGPGRRGLPPAAAGIPAPADRRFRRADVRQGRRRPWRSLAIRAAWLGGGALAALVLAAWLGSTFLNAAVLRVDRVVVRGHAQLSVADVEARLDGIRNESILTVDLERYRLRLLESPWVASADLWRVLPSTVQVRVVERTPLAIARLHGQLYLVDEAGVIIDSLRPQYRQFDLPVVDGLVTLTATGASVDPGRIQLVQRLFRDVSVREDLFRRISQVDVSDAHNAIVLIEGEPAELRLGDRQFLERLQRYEELAPAVRDQRVVKEYYELRFDDRIWVK
jgi:cell division septal protein FtsQ